MRFEVLDREPMLETRLFEIQAEHLRDHRQSRQLLANSREVIQAVFRGAGCVSGNASPLKVLNEMQTVPDSDKKAGARTAEFARCFLRLANLPNFALDRLSRYEATLSRQLGRILFALDALDRRKPQDRTRWRTRDTTQERAIFKIP